MDPQSFKLINEENTERQMPGPRRTKKLAKSKNPDYQQFSAYIRKDYYEQIQVHLIRARMTFSDLMEGWVERWMKERG